MPFIKPLPSWALINRFPAFYDSESLTSVEQTARVYAKMQELIESYNKYVETINAELAEFEAEHDKDYNCFIKTIVKLTDSYISSVDLKLSHMDRTLAENYKAFTDNVQKTIGIMIEEMKANGELDAAILEAVDNLNTKFDNTVSTMEEEYASAISSLKADYEEKTASLQMQYEQDTTTLREDYEDTKVWLNQDYAAARQNLIATYEQTEANLATAFEETTNNLEASAAELASQVDYVIERSFVRAGDRSWRCTKWKSGYFEAYTVSNLTVGLLKAGQEWGQSIEVPFTPSYTASLSQEVNITLENFYTNKNSTMCVIVNEFAGSQLTFTVYNTGVEDINTAFVNYHISIRGMAAV